MIFPFKQLWIFKNYFFNTATVEIVNKGLINIVMFQRWTAVNACIWVRLSSLDSSRAMQGIERASEEERTKVSSLALARSSRPGERHQWRWTGIGPMKDSPWEGRHQKNHSKHYPLLLSRYKIESPLCWGLLWW